MKQILPIFFIFCSVVLLYYPTFNVYFSHDDFFHFKASQTDESIGQFDIKQFLVFFNFPSIQERGYAFYRPLFREALHNLYYSLFGLNHIPMRILIMLIHLFNIVLTYFLILKLFKSWKVALFVAFFFGIGAANVGFLYYIAGGIQVVGVTFFILLSLMMFLRYQNSKKFQFALLSFIFFIAALASHELSFVTPFIVGGLAWLKKRVFSALWVLMLFFVVLGVFIYLDLFVIGFSQGEQQYQPVFSPKGLLNSLMWYTGWAWGLPEMLIDFVYPGFGLNPNLMKFWGGYYIIILPAFFLSIGLFLLGLLYIVVKKGSVLVNKTLWLLFLWFPMVLVPLVLLPFHKSTYYLAPALPAFWGVVGFLGFRAYQIFAKQRLLLARSILLIWLTSLVVLSLVSVRLADKTYPAANRGRIAQKLINDIQVQYPQLPKGAVVFIKNDPGYPKISGDWGGSSKQAAFVLNGSDALQLLYRDTTLKVYYEDLDGLPELPQSQAFPITAKIQLE